MHPTLAYSHGNESLLLAVARALSGRVALMETRVDEIAERIYRLSTFLPQIGPRRFTFNQFWWTRRAPAFSCGQRAFLPAVSRAAARIMDPRRLRWIAFSHIEADECGALGEWLDSAPGRHRHPRRPASLA